jgi:hypothetical protein
MWCTQCHTAFDWRTRRVIQADAPLHNPHYFEWLSNGNVRQNVVDCADRTFYNSINRLLHRTRGPGGMTERTPEINSVIDLLRQFTHLENVNLPYYQHDRMFQHRDIRVRYLQKEYTSEKMQQMLQREEKQAEKRKEILDILQFVIEASKDVLERYIPTVTVGESGDLNILQELDVIREHANDNLITFGKIYKNVPLQLTHLFELK